MQNYMFTERRMNPFGEKTAQTSGSVERAICLTLSTYHVPGNNAYRPDCYNPGSSLSIYLAIRMLCCQSMRNMILSANAKGPEHPWSCRDPSTYCTSLFAEISSYSRIR